ncbi:hypothetical protein A6E04_07785 [Aliivibrio logei]|uniref:Uncharacterized protein n=1 Tax=Aliivibrio logei TaxID=688 RepID=A0A1B9P0D2_ALILO|nr:hypothetical protein A6E04_07785 [Aliivibrio logei]
MVHISQIIPLIDKQLRELRPQEAVQFNTYKKDRGFIIYCIDATHYQILENGFKNASFIGNTESTKKQAKKSLKREFPRSNTVWVDYYQHVRSPLEINEHHSAQISLF